jgi:hypothetical protein
VQSTYKIQVVGLARQRELGPPACDGQGVPRRVDLGHEAHAAGRARALHVRPVCAAPALVEERDDARERRARCGAQTEAGVERLPAIVRAVQEVRVPEVIRRVQVQLVQLEERRVRAQIR